MIRGEDVTVLRKSASGTDAMGEPDITWESETVPDVLWSQAESERLSDGTRPGGTDDTVTFHFPKAYTDDLSGCRISVQGRIYDVLGDPIGYIPAITPGKWNRTVTGRKVE